MARTKKTAEKTPKTRKTPKAKKTPAAQEQAVPPHTGGVVAESAPVFVGDNCGELMARGVPGVAAEMASAAGEGGTRGTVRVRMLVGMSGGPNPVLQPNGADVNLIPGQELDLPSEMAAAWHKAGSAQLVADAEGAAAAKK